MTNSSEALDRLWKALDAIEARMDVLHDDLLTTMEACLYYLRSSGVPAHVDDGDMGEPGILPPGEAPVETEDDDDPELIDEDPPQGGQEEGPSEPPQAAAKVPKNIVRALLRRRRGVPRGTFRGRRVSRR